MMGVVLASHFALETIREAAAHSCDIVLISCTSIGTLFDSPFSLGGRLIRIVFFLLGLSVQYKKWCPCVGP
jgi:hypothetical protein